MRVVTRAPRLIAVLMVVGASLWSLAVSTQPDDPFSTDAAVLVSIGLLMFSVIAAVGLLLPRGRWARNLSRMLLLFQVVLAATVPLRGWALAALFATGLGIVGIQGRWLDGWLRRLPVAEGPGVKPIAFALGCLALVPLIGVASPGGVDIRQGLLGALGVVVAWGYSKAQLWGLWLGRLGLPVISLVAASSAPALGAAAILLAGGALTVLAWSADTRLAISPLMDSLPGPRQIKPNTRGNR